MAGRGILARSLGSALSSATFDDITTGGTGHLNTESVFSDAFDFFGLVDSFGLIG